MKARWAGNPRKLGAPLGGVFLFASILTLPTGGLHVRYGPIADIGSGHSIISSARASSEGGTVRPIALAVLRLITSSYLVGACTGRSAGFSPLRMRST